MPEHVLQSLDSIYGVDAATQQIRDDARNGIQPVSRHETIVTNESSNDTVMNDLEQAYMPENTTVHFAFGIGEFQPLRTYTVDEVTRAKTFIESQKSLRRQQQLLSDAAMGSLLPDQFTRNNNLELESMVSKLNNEQ